jgi:GTP-binding protein
VDRPTARIVEVENEIFDLFCALEANDDQLEYPLIYASAKEGKATSVYLR